MPTSRVQAAIEATWLVCAALVPLAIVPESAMVGFVEVPKIFLARTMVLLLVVLLTLEWAQQPHAKPGRDTPAHVLASLRSNAAITAAFAVLAITAISSLLSPMRSVSVAGTDPGWESYGLISIATYVVVFAAVATHLRTGAQVRRLIWTVTGSAMLLSWYGIAQHFGIDPFRQDATPQSRITLTFGNAIFGGSFLLMTIPLTLALWQGWRERMPATNHVAIGAALIALQTTAFAFTLSRGPIVGLSIALGVLLLLIVWGLGRRAATRPAASVAIAVALAVLMSYVPVPGDTVADNQLGERLSSVGAAFSFDGGGLSGRYTIWETAANVYANGPWLSPVEYPDMPGRAPQPLRWLVGYGPDMFGYAYSLAGDTSFVSRPAHGHNIVVHTLVEMGIAGLAAYATFIGIVGIALLRSLRTFRRGAHPAWMSFLVIGLVAVLAGRAVEQLAGKAQISDLMLSWILAGLIVSLAHVNPDRWPAHATVTSAKNESATRPGQARRSFLDLASPVTATVVAVVALVALVVWWQGVAPYANQAWLVGRAQSASEASGFVRAGDLLRTAVDRSPSSAVPRLVLGRGLLEGARPISDTERRVARLAEASEVVEGALHRNPMDYRAYILQGKILQEAAVFDDSFRESAIAANETAVALLPGLREPREQLALTLLVAGDNAQAIEVAGEALELRSGDDLEGAYMHYVQAKALQEMGRPADAEPFINALESFDHADAPLLVQSLRAQ